MVGTLGHWENREAGNTLRSDSRSVYIGEKQLNYSGNHEVASLALPALLAAQLA